MNKIRESLHLIARNSSAFGLVQPHLERTRLCALPDAELVSKVSCDTDTSSSELKIFYVVTMLQDPRYLRQRAQLRNLVHGLARPKVHFESGRELGVLAEIVRCRSLEACLQAVGGKLLTGPLLADLISRMVEALNSR